MNSSYTIGCAVLGALEKRKPAIGAFIPGIIHGDGGVSKKMWTITGVAIGGLALAAIITSAKG